MVEQLAYQESEEYGKRGSQGRRGQKSADAGQSPVGGQKDGNLGRHGSDDNTEVQSHTGDNRNDQGQHDKGVPGNPGKQLRDHKGQRLFGRNSRSHTQKYKQDHHFILKQQI